MHRSSCFGTFRDWLSEQGAMSCLLVKLSGIPDIHLDRICQIIATEARDVVKHFDVVVTERYQPNLNTPAQELVLQGDAEAADTSSVPEIMVTSVISSATRIVKEKTYTVELKILPSHLTNFIKLAKTNGVGEEFGSIDVLEVRCSTEHLLSPQLLTEKHWTCWQRFVNDLKHFNSSALDRMSSLEIQTAIVANSFVSFNHVVCIVLACGMAAVGLLTDSSVLVLAAFFISPLMSMILAFVWGLSVKDVELASRGLRNGVLGATLCVCMGLAIGFILSIFFTAKDLTSGLDGGGEASYISINTQQIMSRGPPAGNVLVSAIVAALSGVAIALGHGSGIASALTGVCISTSLLPPLVNAGLMWSLQLAYPVLKAKNKYTLNEIGIYSLYLYLVNIICIVLFAWAGFKFKHVGGRTLRPMYRAQGLAMSLESDPATLQEGLLRAFSHQLTPQLQPSRPSSEMPSRMDSLNLATPRSTSDRVEHSGRPPSMLSAP